MAITVTMDSATSPAQLATVVASADIGGQVTSSNAASDSSVKNMTEKTAQNCDMFGSINGMLSDAAQAVKDAYKATTEAVEKLFTDIMSAVGDLTKTIKAIAAQAVAKIQQFCTWLQTASSTVLAQAKAALQAVINGLNSVYTAISDAATAVVNKIGEIASEMFESVKKMLTTDCKMVSGAVSSIGTGAGIDSIVNTVSAAASSVGGAMTAALSNVGDKLTATASSMASTLTGVSAASSSTTSLNASVSTLSTMMA